MKTKVKNAKIDLRYVVESGEPGKKVLQVFINNVAHNHPHLDSKGAALDWADKKVKELRKYNKL